MKVKCIRINEILPFTKGSVYILKNKELTNDITNFTGFKTEVPNCDTVDAINDKFKNSGIDIEFEELVD